jgi:hypothetical protein
MDCTHEIRQIFGDFWRTQRGEKIAQSRRGSFLGLFTLRFAALSQFSVLKQGEDDNGVRSPYVLRVFILMLWGMFGESCDRCTLSSQPIAHS